MSTQLIFPNQESIYNLGQGKVFFIPIDPTTKLATDKGLFVGNVPEEGFILAPAVQSIKHLESQSGKNRTDKALETQQSLQVTIRLENVDIENLTQAIFGTSVRLLEATVTNEIHTVYKGYSFSLERPNVSSFTITNPTGLILNRDYQVNAKTGEVFIPNSSSLVNESLVNIYYVAPPINRITGYSALNTEVWVRYNGLNMADDLKPIVAEVFKVRFSPTSVLDFIKNGFPGMVLELTGEALYEPLLESRVGYEGGIYRVLLPMVDGAPLIGLTNVNLIYNAALSIDGFGSTTNSGVIQADIPAGSTIQRAYLYATSVWSISPVYGVTFNGNTLSLDSATTLSPNSNPATTVRWDVTSIIASSFTGGLQNFNIVENGPSPTNDGAVLVVAYSNPSTQGFTSAILDGELSTTGNTVQFDFASPYSGGDFLVSLAASFSLQPTLGGSGQQVTVIDVTTNSTNNRRLTTSAGGADDRTTGQTSANGNLITVGGIGDNPANPNPTIQPNPFGVGNPDDEYYNLALGNSASATPFILPGDTFLRLTTRNPSNDDNIFGIFVTSRIEIISVNISSI